MAIKSLAQSSILQPSGINSALGDYESNYFHHLETLRLSTSSASISFTNLGLYADFQHLQIRMVARSDEAGSSNLRDLRIQVNTDTGTSYSSHIIRGDGSAVSPVNNPSQSSIFGHAVLPRPTNPTTQFGAAVIDALDVFDTSKYSTFRILAGAKPDGEDQIWLAGGVWMNTAPLTEIKLFANSGNFGSGSRFSLYGFKARS